MKPDRVDLSPKYPKQIINLRSAHFVGECCISETAFPVESGYQLHAMARALASQISTLRDQREANQELEIG